MKKREESVLLSEDNTTLGLADFGLQDRTSSTVPLSTWVDGWVNAKLRDALSSLGRVQGVFTALWEHTTASQEAASPKPAQGWSHGAAQQYLSSLLWLFCSDSACSQCLWMKHLFCLLSEEILVKGRNQTFPCLVTDVAAYFWYWEDTLPCTIPIPFLAFLISPIPWLDLDGTWYMSIISFPRPFQLGNAPFL